MNGVPLITVVVPLKQFQNEEIKSTGCRLMLLCVAISNVGDGCNNDAGDRGIEEKEVSCYNLDTIEFCVCVLLLHLIFDYVKRTGEMNTT